jgi:hypothetical protein
MLSKRIRLQEEEEGEEPTLTWEIYNVKENRLETVTGEDVLLKTTKYFERVWVEGNPLWRKKDEPDLPLMTTKQVFDKYEIIMYKPPPPDRRIPVMNEKTGKLEFVHLIPDW